MSVRNKLSEKTVRIAFPRRYLNLYGNIFLGLILGPIGEKGLRRSLMINDCDPSILFSSAICWVLIALCLIGVFSPVIVELIRRCRRKTA